MNNLMKDKIRLITGGSDGIGYAASRELARIVARVVIASRNAARIETAVQQIIAGERAKLMALRKSTAIAN